MAGIQIMRCFTHTRGAPLALLMFLGTVLSGAGSTYAQTAPPPSVQSASGRSETPSATSPVLRLTVGQTAAGYAAHPGTGTTGNAGAEGLRVGQMYLMVAHVVSTELIVWPHPQSNVLDWMIGNPIVFEFSDVRLLPSPLEEAMSIESLSGENVSFDWELRGDSLVLSPDGYWPPDDTLRILLGDTYTREDPYSITTASGVYPGDADQNGHVDEGDVIPLGRFMWSRGAARTRADLWGVEPAIPWTPRVATHADCDGDGEVRPQDVCEVIEHFGRGTLSKPVVRAVLQRELAELGGDVIRAMYEALLDCPEPRGAGFASLSAMLGDLLQPASATPESYQLFQNYPNPFNAATVIRYEVSNRERVRIDVFDILGRRVQTLVNNDVAPGAYTVEWDGTDLQGSLVASGMYIYQIQSRGLSTQKKMVLLR